VLCPKILSPGPSGQESDDTGVLGLWSHAAKIFQPQPDWGSSFYFIVQGKWIIPNMSDHLGLSSGTCVHRVGIPSA